MEAMTMQHESQRTVYGYRGQGGHVIECLTDDPDTTACYCVRDGADRVIRPGLSARQALAWLDDAELTAAGRALRHWLDSTPPTDWPGRIESAMRQLRNHSDDAEAVRLLRWLGTEAFAPLTRRALRAEGYSPHGAISGLSSSDRPQREAAKRTVSRVQRRVAHPMLLEPAKPLRPSRPRPPLATSGAGTG